jgi:hypothetical protein
MPTLAAGRWSSALGALALLTVSVGLGGCGDTRKALGYEKATPDEFRIVTRAPLSLPPDYSLRPPQPGATRPQEAFGAQAGRQAVLGASQARGAGAGITDGLSPAESALLTRAGVDRADPTIRETVDRESSLLADADRNLLDKIIFWREPDPPGTVVDATKEAQRIRESQALGKGVSDGETPTIRRRRRGALEGIF